MGGGVGNETHADSNQDAKGWRTPGRNTSLTVAPLIEKFKDRLRASCLNVEKDASESSRRHVGVMQHHGIIFSCHQLHPQHHNVVKINLTGSDHLEEELS